MNIEIPYRSEIERILRKMPVMTFRQFLRLVGLITGYEGNQAGNMASMYARNGVILASGNGYVTTKAAVNIVAAGEPEVVRFGINRITELHLRPFYKKAVDCFDVVLDMYPISDDFLLLDDVFQFTFIDEERNRLYEVAKIPSADAISYEALFRSLPSPGSFKDILTRIAVIDEKEAARYVPKVGFSYICVPDKRKPSGYDIVEKRTEGLWDDVGSLRK